MFRSNSKNVVEYRIIKNGIKKKKKKYTWDNERRVVAWKKHTHAVAQNLSLLLSLPSALSSRRVAQNIGGETTVGIRGRKRIRCKKGTRDAMRTMLEISVECDAKCSYGIFTCYLLIILCVYVELIYDRKQGNAHRRRRSKFRFLSTILLHTEQKIERSARPYRIICIYFKIFEFDKKDDDNHK